MNAIKLAKELHETDAHSALLRVNKGRKQEDKLTKKQFLEKLRRAYFLNTGATGKSHNPQQNQPFSIWMKERFARVARFTFNHKGSETAYNQHSQYLKE
ncbi:hypothetical protein AB835_03670 [Candidatus Endobugula sertula]|uniref:Uncharacterized protein n=1 Tax=Candidatus Endobugula sertula TaxID=62101 RepID=A0A1D2QS47_9GAMM|nr:hypothetical protein AB835_03670 [Candidatus Endobugula sertula]